MKKGTYQNRTRMIVIASLVIVVIAVVVALGVLLAKGHKQEKELRSKETLVCYSKIDDDQLIEIYEVGKSHSPKIIVKRNSEVLCYAVGHYRTEKECLTADDFEFSVQQNPKHTVKVTMYPGEHYEAELLLDYETGEILSTDQVYVTLSDFRVLKNYDDVYFDLYD